MSEVMPSILLNTCSSSSNCTDSPYVCALNMSKSHPTKIDLDERDERDPNVLSCSLLSGASYSRVLTISRGRCTFESAGLAQEHLAWAFGFSSHQRTSPQPILLLIQVYLPNANVNARCSLDGCASISVPTHTMNQGTMVYLMPIFVRLVWAES